MAEMNNQLLRKSSPTVEGAGVRLRRVFGYFDQPTFDPFLLLDDFRGDREEDYTAGFPWHPHRGIETVTYMLAGEVEHGDSLGNAGKLGPGDIQWMTAGSGIVHQEMPKGDETGKMHGFQLWANLPASHKMMEPRYQDIGSNKVPMTSPRPGVDVRVLCGVFNGVKGPVEGIVIDPIYLDVRVSGKETADIPLVPGHTSLVYVIGGKGTFNGDVADDRTCVLLEPAETLRARGEDEGLRFLFIAGRPIGEPVAWRGPIVMNTETELARAFQEYREGTFIKNT